MTRLKEFAAALSFYNTTRETLPFWKESLLEMKHGYTILNLNLKRRSMEWRHPNSPRTKKFKAQKSAAKIMATVFLILKVKSLRVFCQKGKPLTQRYTLRLLGSSKQKFDMFDPTWTWQMCSSSMTMHVLTQASRPWRPSLHLDEL